MKRTCVPIAFVACLVLATPSSAAAPGQVKASSDDFGEYSVYASVNTVVRRPKKIWVAGYTDRVGAFYAVDWSVSCERTGGDFDYEDRDGGFTATAAGFERLPLPYRAKTRKTCDVSASIEWDNDDPDFDPLPTTGTVEIRTARR